MEYRNRAKNRKLKRIIQNIYDGFKFKGVSLPVESKLTIFWAIISGISLLFSWIESSDGSIYEGAFSSMAGISGYVIALLVIISLFTLLSYGKKEKLKMSTDLHFQDHNIILTSGTLVVLFSISALRYIWWLQILSSSIIYGKWPIVSIVWGIIIFIWGILMRKKKLEKIHSVYINEISDSDEQIDGENNMKLPF